MTNASTPIDITRIASRRQKGRSPLGANVSRLDWYSIKVIQLELAQIKKAWIEYKFTRDRNRDAVYNYLQAVFDLVSKWRERGDASETSCRALGRSNRNPQIPAEPFAAVIFCTSDPTEVDRKARSKWSRALQFADRRKRRSKPLDRFIRSKGGINECAALLSRVKRNDV
jgi:hypothetical protein